MHRFHCGYYKYRNSFKENSYEQRSLYWKTDQILQTGKTGKAGGTGRISRRVLSGGFQMGDRSKRTGYCPYEEEMHWKNGSRWWNNSFTMQQSPRIYDGLCSMAQIHEMQKAYDKAVCDYKRIIKCLKEDYGVEHGEQVEQYEREIERLKNL